MRTIFILQKRIYSDKSQQNDIYHDICCATGQLLLLVNVATMEMKHIKIFIVITTLVLLPTVTAKFSNSNFLF